MKVLRERAAIYTQKKSFSQLKVLLFVCLRAEESIRRPINGHRDVSVPAESAQ